ncbi:MAG: TadE/TadG family type IV pilus assembly protein [Negativicutes bacterium]
MLGIKKYIRDNRGQAVVEFALIVPVLLLLVLGIMEFSMVIHQYMVVAGASREGARAAALGGSDADIEAAVQNAVSGLDSAKLIVTPSPTPTRTQGDPVTVTVTYPFKPVTPLIGAFFSEDYRIKGITVMRVE